jgi:hypothetical protein
MMHHGTCSRQRGLSSIGFVFMLGIAAFFLLLLSKIGPLYLDNSFVSAALNKMANENIEKMTNYQIRNVLSKHFTINSIRDVSVKQLVIERTSAKIVLKMDYEKRINLMGNLDVVTIFENHYDSSTPK